MTSLVIFALLGAALFFASYITKRRFGMLGLALGAGAMLSMHWAATLTPFLEKQGVVLVVPPLERVVQAALVLAPACALLFRGPTYNKTLPRLAGSAAFALLALSFLVDILSNMLVVDGPGATIVDFLHNYQNLLIIAGIVGAVADLLFTRAAKHKENKRGAH